MAVHDWTRVTTGIFHDFHREWISSIKRALNRGGLPPGFYALAEQIAGGLGSNVLTLRKSRIAIRHSSNHEVIAVIEIVSPGNKGSRHAWRTLVEKAYELLAEGIHLLVLDLFPPGPRDPQGVHKAIWSEIEDDHFMLPADKPLTLAAYSAGPVKRAFVEPVAVGDELPDMPLFLEPERYVPVPLAVTYQAAWEGVPEYWREQLN